MDQSSAALTLLITSWLEPELVERIRAVDSRVNVVYRPDLLRPPRYPADHHGEPVERTPEQEAQWRGLLARADILFDFDPTHRDDLPELARRVRWIQATSAGIGQFVKRQRYAERMPHTVFTTASGVHAKPLAEFAAMAMLMHSRRLLHMVDAQGRREWKRFAGTDLDGRTLLVVGLGSIGREVARLARAMGMEVLGVRRSPGGEEGVYGPEALTKLLPRADFVVLVMPHTDETDGMMGGDELAAMKQGSVLINIGRGSLVDEGALVDALRSGHLGGAYLDVFATEPLPDDSPLWDMPNVLVSPHSGSTSDRENRRITELFCENLRRYLEGRPLKNVLDPARLY
jgi:phosphoglycerate dehydrogenase-like enzyme